MRSRVDYFGFRDYNTVYIVKNNFTVTLDKHTHTEVFHRIYFFTFFLAQCVVICLWSFLCTIRFSRVTFTEKTLQAMVGLRSTKVGFKLQSKLLSNLHIWPERIYRLITECLHVYGLFQQ